MIVTPWRPPPPRHLHDNTPRYRRARQSSANVPSRTRPGWRAHGHVAKRCTRPAHGTAPPRRPAPAPPRRRHRSAHPRAWIWQGSAAPRRPCVSMTAQRPSDCGPASSTVLMSPARRPAARPIAAVSITPPVRVPNRSAIRPPPREHRAAATNRDRPRQRTPRNNCAAQGVVSHAHASGAIMPQESGRPHSQSSATRPHTSVRPRLCWSSTPADIVH